jgi:predicted anti-sigma-YlaC factor YlaD
MWRTSDSGPPQPSGVVLSRIHGWRAAAALGMVLCATSGCSIQRLAARSVGDMLASGSSVYETDGDPELVGDALPFGLKVIESVLAEQPEHRKLLLAAARGYLLYSYAYVSQPAQRLQLTDAAAAQEARQRARNLALRSHDYATRALLIDYPGIDAALRETPEDGLLRVDDPGRDVAPLYWSSASLALAISSSRNEPALLARLPEVEAMLQRALTLDEAWNAGALHELAITLASAARSRDDATLAQHYERALELSAGSSAGLHVSYAEVVAVPKQDRALFVTLLERALAVDTDAYPEQRLLNVLAQRRARWLLENADQWFLE